jgi:hypothetical protein
VFSNQLTGALPLVTTLNTLRILRVENNPLSDDVPCAR